LETFRVAVVGDEQITVPAGPFNATHFRITPGHTDVSPADLWVTGEDHILVKYDWNELGLEYVLESLIVEPSSLGGEENV
jgi:hypothetical protein